MLSTTNNQITQAAANAMIAAQAALYDGGSESATLSFYEGAVPATADTAITTQTLLCTLTMGSPAFGLATAGAVEANAIVPAAAVASSTFNAVQSGLVFARARDSSGTTIQDFMVGVVGSTAAVIVPVATIIEGVTIEVSTFTLYQPLGS